MENKESEIMRRAIEIAKLLNAGGLTMKECTIVNQQKRVSYTRGDKLLEAIENNKAKITNILTGTTTEEVLEPPTIAQRLLRDKMIVKLERVNEEKKYVWPRKLLLVTVLFIQIIEYFV